MSITIENVENFLDSVFAWGVKSFDGNDFCIELDTERTIDLLIEEEDGKNVIHACVSDNDTWDMTYERTIKTMKGLEGYIDRFSFPITQFKSKKQ